MRENKIEENWCVPCEPPEANGRLNAPKYFSRCAVLRGFAHCARGRSVR